MDISALNLKKVVLGVVVATVVFTTLLLLPFTENFILDSKAYGLFFAALLVTLLFLVQAIQRRSFNLVLAPYTVAILLFGFATIVSTFLTNTYPIEHLLDFGGVYLSMVLIAVLGGSLLPKNSRHTFINVLAISCGLLTLASTLELVGAGPSHLFNQLFQLNLPNNLLFNLSGSSFIAIQLLIVTLVGMVATIVSQKHLPKMYAVLLPIIVIGIGVHGWSLLPGKPSQLQLPSFSAGWSVALDAIRLPRAALIGVGPSSYRNVYTQYKPLWINNTPQWNVLFSQGANVPLTILTTMGFIGLLAWTLLSLKLAKEVKSAPVESRPLAWMAGAMLVLQLIFPPNIVLFAILGLTLAVMTAARREHLPVLQIHALSANVTGPRSLEEVLRPRQKNQVVTPFSIIAFALVLGVGALIYFTGRAYAAQVLLAQANRAAANDDGLTLYLKQQQAVQLNPYLDDIRRRYAVTSILIAIAISNKTELTEDEQLQVTELLQQSIREARSAALLDQTDNQNWQVLAQIYQNIISATPEAAQWSVQSYVQAIQTNPTDPNLRVTLGGIFLGQNQPSEAASLFQQAVELKPDHPNAHYNLAVALRLLNQLPQSKLEYQRVLVLLDPASEDYVRVTQELEELDKVLQELSAEEATASGQTSTGPSIINQNIEDGADVVNNPSTGNVDATQEVTPTQELPASTPGVEN